MTRPFAGRATAAMFFFGRAPEGARQSPNARSSSGFISAMVASPAMKIVALSGRSQVAWNFVRSPRVNALIEAGVPEPVKGTP